MHPTSILSLQHLTFCRLDRLGELEAIKIEHPAFTATILLQGAQLITYAPTGQANWFWVSEHEPFRHGKSVRGGIPVCWPWFGAVERNPEAVRHQIRTEMAHGFVRTGVWTLTDIDEQVDAVSITLSLETDRAAESLWEGRARADMKFVFTGHDLSATLETHNLAAEPMSLTAALHSYFPTSDVEDVSLHGLEGVEYVDTLHDWRRCQQSGAVRFSGETDRIYFVGRPLRLRTPERTYVLTPSGSGSAIVWNPWIEKARRLSHFGENEWRRMFCVETANALDDSVTLSPGQSHSLGFRLTLS